MEGSDQLHVICSVVTVYILGFIITRILVRAGWPGTLRRPEDGHYRAGLAITRDACSEEVEVDPPYEIAIPECVIGDLAGRHDIFQLEIGGPR